MLKKIKDLKYVKVVREAYDNQVNKILETPLNKKLDAIGGEVQNEFFTLIKAKDESMFWRRITKRLKVLGYMFVGGFFLVDITHMIKDKFRAEWRNFDLAGYMLVKSNRFEEKYFDAHDKILRDHISKESMNVLGWLSIGQRFADAGLSEFAFHAFYMAHLINPDIIKTNADLKFDTSLPPGVTPKAEGNIDELLDTLLTD